METLRFGCNGYSNMSNISPSGPSWGLFMGQTYCVLDTVSECLITFTFREAMAMRGRVY